MDDKTRPDETGYRFIGKPMPRKEDARLVTLKDEVRAQYPGDQAIAPAPVSEFALAWVRAV